jgi:hypothetical protein
VTVTNRPPRDPRDRALDALRSRRPGALVLDIRHDTLLDGPLPGQEREGAHRLLVFGRDDLALLVQVRYAPDGDPTEMLVEGVPPGATVEVLTEAGGPRVVERGEGSLRLLAPADALASVLLTLPGGAVAQTAWLVP